MLFKKPTENISEIVKLALEGSKIHPLLIQQFGESMAGKKYLSTGDFARFFKDISDTYYKSEKEKKQKEELLKSRIKELNTSNEQQQAQREIMKKAFDEAKEKNAELTMLKERGEAQKEIMRKAYEELKKTHSELTDTQDQLIFSEKMASLGQLVAGIAHEINTPLSVINGGLQNMEQNLDMMMEELPPFMKTISDQGLDVFQRMVKASSENEGKLNMTTREERKQKKALNILFEEKGITSATLYARDIVEMGLAESFESFADELKDIASESFFENLTKVGKFSFTIGNMSTAVKKMKKIVFSLRNYAHHGDTEEAIQTNLVGGIETIITLYFNQIKKGIELVRNYDESSEVYIIGFADELDQVWTNIISNAIQAMNYKGTLTIDITEDETNATVKITDSGSGMPDEVKAKIFQPFFTTKAQGEGSGLGLPICKKIIDKHNGILEVDSEPGRTCFTITLPKEFKG